MSHLSSGYRSYRREVVPTPTGLFIAEGDGVIPMESWLSECYPGCGRGGGGRRQGQSNMGVNLSFLKHKAFEERS